MNLVQSIHLSEHSNDFFKNVNGYFFKNATVLASHAVDKMKVFVFRTRYSIHSFVFQGVENIRHNTKRIQDEYCIPLHIL